MKPTFKKPEMKDGGATGRKPKGGGKDPHPGRLPGGTR
jgi:hypothetical protein